MPTMKTIKNAKDETPTSQIDAPIFKLPRKRANPVNTAATITRYFCSGATFTKKRLPPKTNATEARMNTFSILEPKISPSANPGLGGSKRTAEILVDNSGNDVAKAINRLPTKSRPNPVSEASASPYTASLAPQNITVPALAKKTNMATDNSSPMST